MNSLSNKLPENNQFMILLEEARQYIHESIQGGAPAHEVEKRAFDYALQFGRTLLAVFFQAQGNGDVGEGIILPDKGIAKRLNQHMRIYRSILGNFTLNRYVYGTREALSAREHETKFK